MDGCVGTWKSIPSNINGWTDVNVGDLKLKTILIKFFSTNLNW